MAPTEESILFNFLLSPSPLPNVVSLEKFTKLFPKRLQSHPQIRALYRDLQYLRAQDIDLVRENIYTEIERGEKQKKALKDAQSNTGVAGISPADEVETNLDIHLFGQQSSSKPAENHKLQTLLVDMERACLTIESNINSLEVEASEALGRLSTVVGDLSDLRYGKFNAITGGPRFATGDVSNGLKLLEEACNKASEE
ncbi:hypothetical protein FQN57_001311 [Myotisia sp. PD_48]|nr:hypothetical protein FQN57_001311 [Myotisia sp. PD_48]